jgi:hypothetical protein
MINHCDIHITLLSDTDTVQSETWHDKSYHSDLSRYVSDYCISISRKSGRSIIVIYHAMSLTTVSVS